MLGLRLQGKRYKLANGVYNNARLRASITMKWRTKNSVWSGKVHKWGREREREERESRERFGNEDGERERERKREWMSNADKDMKNKYN